MNTPAKIICFCGSLRIALEAFKKAEYESVLNGTIALLPCCMFVDIEREYGAESDYKTKADDLHKRKIDICDEVFVLNVDHYIGSSTLSEIEYAESIGKKVKYLKEDLTDDALDKFGFNSVDGAFTHDQLPGLTMYSDDDSDDGYFDSVNDQAFGTIKTITELRGVFRKYSTKK